MSKISNTSLKDRALDNLNLLATAFIAGILIVIGCAANLKLGGLAGAIFFGFALMSIVLIQMSLLTGAFGARSFDWGALGIIFIGNMLGCGAAGWAVGHCLPDLAVAAAQIIDARTASGLLSNFLLSIPCGMIVTIAIATSEESLFPLLMGVPIFVICGFPHCIADAGYMFIGSKFYWGWLLTIVGNYIGCNFFRTYLWEISDTQKPKPNKKIGF